VTTSTSLHAATPGAARDRFPAGESDRLAERGASATAAEIAQQPALWREVAELVAAQDAQVRAFLDPLLARAELRIVLTGAGTSAFVGDVLAPALTRALGRRIDAVATTDVVSNPREVFAEDVPTLLVSFARSGNSPESSAATQLADRCLGSVHHLVVTCDAEGDIARDHAASDRSYVLLMPAAANDRGFAMTSSFTCMLLATWLVLGPVPAADRAGQVERLAAAAEQVLDSADRLTALADHGYERVVYLGSGPLRGLAREAALKMLELTAGRVVSYFDSALGFRHGPKAVLHDRTLAMVFRSGDPYTRQYDADIITELEEALGAEHVVTVSATGVGAPVGVPLHGLDHVPDAPLTLPFVLVAQLLALRCSLAGGLTPDNPFPDGEVNRVVQGVTVHPLPS
jgi:tagatose-6-phosphate ketose/aldose isomerase